MKKILLIDESSLFRKYLKKKLEDVGCQVLTAINGLDGGVKIRSTLPDLVIMDYYLSRKNGEELLKEKNADPNAAGIPVILAANEIDKKKLLKVAQFNVKKFFTKPLKIDALLGSVAELLGVKVNLDETPCILEAHFNDQILFIEVARGLNTEKIELLQFRILELLQLYRKQNPNVLIIITDIEVDREDEWKLVKLLTIILETTRSPLKTVKILTTSQFVRDFIARREEYKRIEVTDNLNQAMDTLLGIKVSRFITQGKEIVREDFLSSSKPKGSAEASFHLRFDNEAVKSAAQGISIAAVDDDEVIRELIKTAFADTGYQITCFEDGRQFTQALADSSFDLVFLDLLMPEMDGFTVLEYLQDNSIELPVIILSVLSEREMVIKARSFGVKSYMIKPLKADNVLAKTTEVLRMNF